MDLERGCVHVQADKYCNVAARKVASVSLLRSPVSSQWNKNRVVQIFSASGGSSNCFPKRWRLQKRSEFVRIQTSPAYCHHTRHFTVLVSRARQATGRLGITASKKIGNAVARNRAKRMIRETVRQSKWFPLPSDVVIIAKRGASQLTFRDVCNELARLKKRVVPC